jgi:hypothetical protein
MKERNNTMNKCTHSSSTVLGDYKGFSVLHCDWGCGKMLIEFHLDTHEVKTISISELAALQQERDELFQVAVCAFHAVEEMDMKGELSKWRNMGKLDHVCARLSRSLWERVDAAALKGGKE